jgi:uncharacterized glyoxalase superfamily protein PhnB
MISGAYKPPGWPDVVSRIFTRDVEGLAAFLAHVFGAEGACHLGAPTELRIGDSMLMLSDGGGVREPRPAFLYVYVPDVDQAFERAMSLDAVVIELPTDMLYGDRRATVRDPWGNHWQIATRLPAA